MVAKNSLKKGWRTLLIILVVSLFMTLLNTTSYPTQASTKKTVWGSKPLLEHFVLNPALAEELSNEVGLSHSQFQSVLLIAQKEKTQIQSLKAESLKIISNQDWNLEQKRQLLERMEYNRQILGILDENQDALQSTLEPDTYQQLVSWIENKWRVEKESNLIDVGQNSQSIALAAPDQAKYARSFEVYATRYDAGGRYIIALPDKCLKFANGGAMLCNSGYQYGQNYTVAISYKGKTVYAPVLESGPWNIDDNYWATLSDPQPRRKFADLPLGVPEAQAAYFNSYNGGLDQFGRVVTSPVAIDISYAVAKDLGLPSGNNKVTVSFLWTKSWDSNQGAGETPEASQEVPTAGPTALPVIPLVASTPNPDGSIVHIVQQGQTLVGIAAIYDLPLAELLALNGLTMNSIIIPGDRIIIKPPDPTPTETNKRASSTSSPTSQKERETRTPTATPKEATPTVFPTLEDNEGYSSTRNDVVLIIIGGVGVLGIVLLGWSVVANRER